MANELMPCPICGESCTSYREFAELPAKVQCDVMLCNYALESASRAEGIEQHNTLARRAEIGALVERIVGEDNMVKVWIDKDDPWTAESYKPKGLGYTRVQIGGATLLDALRALAKEVGGER